VSKLTLLIGAGALFGLAGLSAFAQEPVKSDPIKSDPVKSDQPVSIALNQLDRTAKAMPFDELDKNKDGFITKDEVPATIELSTSFVNFDTNADGKLSKDEYAKYKPIKDEAKPASERH
jgi:Ca2+-binding EF-hand superfamily protein